jgi:glycosyltransferase involved in cell wall biosynthesis
MILRGVSESGMERQGTETSYWNAATATPGFPFSVEDVKSRAMPDYAIIIPAYNEEAFLAVTIAAAREAMDGLNGEFGTGELIVVNNNSTDRTADVAAEAGADRIVFEPHNQIARARNAGAENTAAERLVFIDADTRVESGTLRQALAFLASGEVAAGGARIVMDQAVSPMVDWLVRTWNRIAAGFDYAAGSFFFARRDAFEAGGRFDETVYAGEEVWLARRIKAWAKPRGLGFRIISDPPVVTSGRKSDWFSTGDFIGQLAIIFLIPWATRSRRLCAMWYRRPAQTPE